MDAKANAERILEGFIIVILAFIPAALATWIISIIGLDGTTAMVVEWITKAWATGWIAYVVVGKVNL